MALAIHGYKQLCGVCGFIARQSNITKLLFICIGFHSVDSKCINAGNAILGIDGIITIIF